MATPAQIIANRLNAQKSTGPSSAEGKAASRFNALKHAASAQSLIIPGEEEAALAELADQYQQQFQPVGPEEALLVEKIIAADWTQRRMHRLETEVLNALINQQDPDEQNPVGAAYINDCAGPNALQKIFRRREAASREWLRSLKQLRELQALRFTVAPPPRAPRPHAPLAQPQATIPLPCPSDEAPVPKFGFVFDESTPSRLAPLT